METAKSQERRLREGWYEKYAPADKPGLDIGCGEDPLYPENPLWIQVDNAFNDWALSLAPNRHRLPATRMPFADGTFTTVYASHILEHIANPLTALREWWRLLAPGGHLIVCVPHRDLYEKRLELPSIWNPDHKWFWVEDETPGVEQAGWPFTLGIHDVFFAAIQQYPNLHPEVRVLRDGYDANGDDHPLGEFSIEAIVRKPASDRAQ
jgi:SAM-dependent methyltransferase